MTQCLSPRGSVGDDGQRLRSPQGLDGHKGTGLALVFGILSAVLSGASYGPELGNLVDGPKAGADGHFFLALKVGVFEDPAWFKGRVDRIIRQIRHIRRAPGVGRIYLPGELEVETEYRYRSEGILLSEATLTGITAAGSELGMPRPCGPLVLRRT